MGQAAQETVDDGSTSLPPLGMPPASAHTPATPPPAAGGAPVSPAPAGAPPAPTALPPVPYQTRIQPDGSVAAYIPSPDGNPANDVVIGVAPAFKVPKAFSQPVQPQQPTMQ